MVKKQAFITAIIQPVKINSPCHCPDLDTATSTAATDYSISEDAPTIKVKKLILKFI